MMVKKVLLFTINIYQIAFSALLGQRCRFYPSCSEYAKQAIEIHGVLKGVSLGARRVCKCHPFHPGGIDLVPPNDHLKV